MRDPRPAVILGILGILTALVAFTAPASAAVKPRVVLVAPFDAGTLPADDRWIGEGIGQVVTLGLAQHPAFVQLDKSRLRALGQPETWGEAAVIQAAKVSRADAALFGEVSRTGSDYTVRPRLVELKAGAAPEVLALEPVTIPDSELLTKLSVVVVAYARTLKVPLTDGDIARMEKAARPTKSMRAFELFARSETAARRGGQEGNESAADLLARAIEADPNFVVAQYTLGVVHQALVDQVCLG